MSGSLYWRLEIRTAADDADLLVLSSYPGDDNPYLSGPPSGDGQRIDPITGKSSIGAYTIRTVDVVTSGADRVVTSKLVDSAKRQQLISRRAYIKYSEDGSDWSVLVAGWVNRVRLIGALTFEFSVGETQRQEQNIEIFKRVTTTYDQVSCLCGGPVRGGFGPLGNYGPWKMRVAEVVTGKYVRLKYLSGYQRRAFGSIQLPTGGYQYVAGVIQNVEDERVNAISREYNKPLSGLVANGILSYYPGLEARVENASGTVLGFFTPLNRIDPVGIGSGGGHIALVDNSDLNLQWDGTHGLDSDRAPNAPDQPDDESIVYVYVYPTEISENNPIHLTGHPCDIITGLWDDAGLPYSSTAAATAKAAIGPMWLNLRVKQSYKLGDFVAEICAFAGLAVRFNTSGERALVSTRIPSSTAPATTITLSDLRDVGPSIFDVSEKGAINKVTVKTERYSLWRPGQYGNDNTRPIDELVVTPITNSVTDDSATNNGEHEQVFEIPGQLLMEGMPGLLGDFGWIVNPDGTETTYTLGLSRALFDRRKTGAITGELACVRGVTAVPGDEITLDLDHLPNDNDRGGERIVQVLGRTETPGGPTLYIEDAGTSVQPLTKPTYTIAKDTAGDPKRFAKISVTNTSSLITDGSSARVEMALGSSPTSWMHLATLTPAEMATVTNWITPRCNAGSVVNVRMRSEQAGKRPTAYQTAAAVTLSALTAPTSLSATADGDDDTIAILTWTAGETTQPVVVEWKETADTNYDHSVTLPAGSTQYTVRGLTASTAYTFRAFYREQAPWSGESSVITDTLTMGDATPDCAEPENPRAFAGSVDPATGGLVVDGTFGLEVTATELPSATVFEVAVETSAGSDTYDTYTAVPGGTVQSVQGARTVWRGVAPNDGLRRSIRAKATAPGKDDSSYTTAVDVDPWTPTAPVDLPIACPDITLTAVTAMVAGVGSAAIRVSFTAPSKDWLAEMRYSVRFRDPDGEYGAPFTVRGTASGPDMIPAQYGLQYEVTPSAVTSDGQATTGTAATITVSTVVGSIGVEATAGSSEITYDIEYTDNRILKIEVWTVQADSDLGDASQEGAVGATFFGTLYRYDDRRSLSFAVDATNDWRTTTFIPYANTFRGEVVTLSTQREASVTVPDDLGAVVASSTTSNSVTNKVFLAVTHVAGDEIEAYRDGASVGSLYAITAADVTAGFALVETTGLSPDTLYSWKYKAVRDGVRSANFTTAINATTDLPEQFDAPSLIATRDGSSPDTIAIVTITPGDNDTGLGTFYQVEASATGTGGWSVKTTTAEVGDNAVSHSSSETFFRAKARANLFGSESEYSLNTSLPGD